MRIAVLALAVTILAAAAPALAAERAAARGRPAPEPGGGTFPLARATPDEVKGWLGEPAVASEEGRGALWTYRLDDCALMIFFRDEGAGLKVSGVATGPRRRGQAAPDAETCVAAAKK